MTRIKYTATYVDGTVISLQEEDFSTAMKDIAKYSDEDLTNSYSIKSLLIEVVEV